MLVPVQVQGLELNVQPQPQERGQEQGVCVQELVAVLGVRVPVPLQQQVEGPPVLEPVELTLLVVGETAFDSDLQMQLWCLLPFFFRPMLPQCRFFPCP